MLGVPLLRDGEPIGAFALSRSDPVPFTERQLELVATFADQAVIAIENARLLGELRERTRDLEESLEQQTATAEVLKVISRSAFDLDPVFQAVAATAVRLCRADQATIYRYQDGEYRWAAGHSLLPDYERIEREVRIRPGTGTLVGRVALEGRAVQIPDAWTDPLYEVKEDARVGGVHTMLGVPLLRDGVPIGVIGLARQRIEPYTEQHVALVSTFAEQAVIAIGSAATFQALQERTGELTRLVAELQALEEVLRSVNSSLDLETVLSTIISRAVQLSQSDEGMIYEFDPAEQVFVPKAAVGMTENRIARLRERRIRIGETYLGRSAVERAPVRISDVQQDPSTPEAKELLQGIHAVLAVPLLREDKVIGGLVIRRRSEGAFEDATVKLLQTFAAQSVLAIANARLFDEVQARTRELTESLEIQSATADVLKAISRTAFDLNTVLTTLIETAMRLCNATTGQIFRREGDIYRYSGSHLYMEPAYVEHEKRAQIRAGRGTLIGRVALEKRSILIDDAWNDPEYEEKDAARMGKVRAMLGVPLMRDGEPIGAFALAREEPIPFTNREIELVTTFADQAVIAIENVRLFDEVQARTKELTESLEIQSATADVLKAISRSAFDLDTVLDTLTRSAANLCSAATGLLYIRESEQFRVGAMFGHSPALIHFRQSAPTGPGRGSSSARVALSHAVEQILDMQTDPEVDPGLKAVTTNRTALAVPLLRDDRLEGIFVLGRTYIEAFSQRQIELVQTFADQALIAIENARLFNEVQARTRELAKSLDDLRTAQDRLIQTEKLASLGQLTAGIAHEIKNPLNFVNNFSALSVDLIDDLRTALAPAPLEPATRAEVDEVAELLRSNLEKVVQHGKRADAIVRNMLLHAREGSGERRQVDFNATVEEALNLAYHGARAERPGFNVTLERHYDPAAGSLELYPQEFTRVLLNLIGNGFYAVDRRRRDSEDAIYAPTVAVTTEAQPDAVIVRVRDNGTGIPDAVKARLFEPFFTTKPAGEGTGLGLSISHDIIVKQHSGSIAVASRPGEYTEFTITLPRTAAGALA